MTVQHSNTDILTPPGGLVVWVFVFMELLIFGAALVFFSFQKSQNLTLFAESQQLLNPTLGFINTIILITSGYCMAQATRWFDRDRWEKAAQWVSPAFLLGSAFIVIKGIEYSEKIAKGIDFSTNAFFGYYWLITLFHAIHVILGLFFLITLLYKLIKKLPFAEEDAGVHTIAVYWHMCDIIWILVFPVLYLL